MVTGDLAPAGGGIPVGGCGCRGGMGTEGVVTDLTDEEILAVVRSDREAQRQVRRALGKPIDPEVKQQVLSRLAEATGRIVRLQEEISEAGFERASALAVFADHGMSYREIGELVGLSQARVGQMLASLRTSEGGEQ